MSTTFISEFEELSLEEQEEFKKHAREAFSHFPDGATFDDRGNVTLTPLVQARVTYNAMSHRQQVHLMSRVLLGFVQVIKEEITEPSFRMIAVMSEIITMFPPEFVQKLNQDFDAFFHDVDDQESVN